MRRRRLLAVLMGGLTALAAACTPSLETFNRLVPRDGGASLAAAGIAYGAGPRQALDVYVPAGAHADAPVIVFIYGGSWASGRRQDYGFVGAAFASRGFVTIVPDYRIAPDVFPSFLEDGAAAIAWTREHAASYGGDPDNIVLVGQSAGAYNAIMLALDAHYLRDAGVPLAAIKGAAGLAGPYDFLPYDVASTRNAFGHVEDETLTQPVTFARADAPPLFLAWGDDDTLVGRRNIDGLSAAMRAAHGRVETKIYPGIGHAGILLALSRPLRGRAPVLDDVTAFATRVTTAPSR